MTRSSRRQQLATVAGTTFVETEGEKYRVLSSKWWHRNGPFKGLHSMNELRVPFVRDSLLASSCNRSDDSAKSSFSSSSPSSPSSSPSSCSSPLDKLGILDVGCGGGILVEPLARLGASVTGLDPVEESINVARSHLSLPANRDIQSRVNYVCATIEQHRTEASNIGRYDAVVASEVVEHVRDPREFVSICSDLVKPGGSLFLTTMNRTVLSWLGGIVAAEYLLRLVPLHTHEWDSFLKPEELSRYVSDAGLERVKMKGMAYNPILDRWSWSECVEINYALQAIKR